jgi:uncharacterized membrane protein
VTPVDEPFTHARTASLVAYAGGWATGALVWLLDSRHPEVRFHALQSMLAFGALTLAWGFLWAGSFAALLMSSSAFVFLQRAALGVFVIGLGLWAVCLWLAWRGRTFKLPFVGRWAEQRSATRAA